MEKKKRGTPKHFTSEHQRHARSRVSSESCSRNGAKGAKVTIERHGVDALFVRWQAWKLANPSKPERLMIELLERLKVRFEREKRLGKSLYTVDFYLPATGQAIEVDSHIHSQFDVEKRRRQASTKHKLLSDLGIPCLFIWDTELFPEDQAPVIKKIEDFLNR